MDHGSYIHSLALNTLIDFLEKPVLRRVMSLECVSNKSFLNGLPKPSYPCFICAHPWLKIQYCCGEDANSHRTKLIAEPSFSAALFSMVLFGRYGPHLRVFFLPSSAPA